MCANDMSVPYFGYMSESIILKRHSNWSTWKALVVINHSIVSASSALRKHLRTAGPRENLALEDDVGKERRTQTKLLNI